VRVHFAAAPFCREKSDIVSSRPPPQVSSCAKNGPFDSRVQITRRCTSTHTHTTHISLMPSCERASKRKLLYLGQRRRKKGKVARRWLARLVRPTAAGEKVFRARDHRSAVSLMAPALRKTINAALTRAPSLPRVASQQFNYHLISCANDAAARAVANFAS
jgi:hypothetical protein